MHLQIIFLRFSVHIYCLSLVLDVFALYLFNNFLISRIVFIFSVPGYTSIKNFFYLHVFDLNGQGRGGGGGGGYFYLALRES